MKKLAENPIVTPAMAPPSAEGYRVRGAFNPGAVRFGDEILLLMRVAEDCVVEEGRAAVPTVRIEDGVGRPDRLEVSVDNPDVRLKDTRGIVYKGVDYLSTMSHLRLARSRDGIHFTVDDQPLLFPSAESEIFGVEDARITRIEDTYYINYTAVSPDGWATALASTRDFVTVQRHGLIFHPLNKDVSIFPRKVGGKYCALHRPHNEGFGKPSIWYAESPDLLHWGNYRCLLRPRETEWEVMKIGGGAPCILTDEGWLQIYHGKGEGQKYSLFPVLLDREEPWRVLRRATLPILKPEEDYERSGFFGNVVFTNGIVEMEDGRLLVYYGASDQYSCVAETSVEEMLAAL